MIDDASILWARPTQFLMATPDPPPPEVEDRISELAVRNLIEVPADWDGPLLRLVEFTSHSVVAQESSYRYLRAARAGEACRDWIFLAVTGVLNVEGHFILGRRSKELVGAGKWEFAPAGGIEAFPPEEQLAQEIREELSLENGKILIGAPVALFVEKSEFVADLIMPVVVKATVKEVLEGFEAGEYAEIIALEREDLIAFAIENSVDFPSLSRHIVTLIRSGVIG